MKWPWSKDKYPADLSLKGTKLDKLIKEGKELENKLKIQENEEVQNKIKELRKNKAINIKGSRYRIKLIESKNKKIIDEIDINFVSIRNNKWGDWLVIPYFDVDVFMKSIVDISSIPGEEKHLDFISEYRSYSGVNYNDIPSDLYYYDILKAETPTYIKFHLSTGRVIWMEVPLEIGEVIFEAVNSLWRANRK